MGCTGWIRLGFSLFLLPSAEAAASDTAGEAEVAGDAPAAAAAADVVTACLNARPDPRGCSPGQGTCLSSAARVSLDALEKVGEAMPSISPTSGGGLLFPATLDAQENARGCPGRLLCFRRLCRERERPGRGPRRGVGVRGRVGRGSRSDGGPRRHALFLKFWERGKLPRLLHPKYLVVLTRVQRVPGEKNHFWISKGRIGP